jgi:hypothetical protein
MRWPWRARRDPVPPVLPLDDIDPATLEILELDDAGHRIGPPDAADDALREVAYERRLPDPAGLAGLWEALEHA